MQGQTLSRSQWVVLAVLLVLLVVGAIPHYFSGQPSGAALPRVQVLSALGELRDTGVDVPGWDTLQQQTIELGDRRWSEQVLQWQALETSEAESDQALDEITTVILLLMPQKYHDDRPLVEWTDLQGVQSWIEDSQQSKQFAAPGNPEAKPTTVTARFLRGWRETEGGTIITTAMLQWYLWPGGGHWSPNPWFWEDWWVQWHDRRLPWVAVAILLPIEPLGDIESVWPTIEPLAKTVQQTLTDLLVSS